MNVYDKAYELSQALKESREYKEFKSISEIIDNNPKNKEMLMDFKKKQFELQASQMMGKEPPKEKIEQLQQLYGILIANPDISKYFEAEYRFERLVSDIYRIIGDAIEIKVGFLKEIEQNLTSEILKA